MYKSIDKPKIEEYFSTPQARWNGDEYLTLNPLRKDSSIGSFSINSKKGIYHDFSSNDSGTIISLLSFVNEISKQEAEEKLYGKVSNSKEKSFYDKWYDENFESLNIRSGRDRSKPNQYSWEHYDDSNQNWKSGKNSIKTTLYNLLKVKDAHSIFFVEGEGVCEKLQAECNGKDFAVTTSGSCTSWKTPWIEHSIKMLKGKTVYILPDNDKEGRQYSNEVLKSLLAAGIEAYIVDLPGLEQIQILKKDKLIKEKQDVKDWLENGHTFEELLTACDTARTTKERIAQGETLSWEEIYSHTKSLNAYQTLEFLLSNKIDVRFNVVTSQIEFKLKESNDWLIIDDRYFDELQYDINLKLDKTISAETLKRFLNRKNNNDFDPFLEFTRNLETPSSFSLEGSEFNRFLKLISLEDENHRESFDTVFTKWLVAAYSLMAGKVDKNEICPVLSGKQGIGKNRIVDKLFEVLDQKFIFTGSIQADDKDSKRRIASSAVIHLDEFNATTRRSEMSSLKSLITLRDTTDRMPYATHATILKRRASFIASINDASDFLIDDTGNRRFPSFRLKDIDLDQMVDVDTRQIWNEIKYLAEIENVSCFFTKEEIEKLEAINSEFKKCNPTEEYIEMNFRSSKDSEFNQELKLTSAQLYDKIIEKGFKSSSSAQTIGKILSRLGYRQSRPNNGRIWEIYSRIDF
jgi:hypothetical protein